MKVCDHVKCPDFPCRDVEVASHVIPNEEIDPRKIRIAMITEAPPADKRDYYYSKGNPFYLQTTLQAFKDAGVDVSTMKEILDAGVYITTAIKCGKKRYSISLDTIKNCSRLLEKEIALFPYVKAFMLMGDVAIKSMNRLWKEKTGERVIPSGSTYKIRKQKFFYQDRRVFPSYTPAGKNFLIEKSKRKMVAEDIRAAMRLIK